MSSAEADTAAVTRDFTSHPAIVEIDDAGEVYAVSDVHGQYDVFVDLLAGNKLVDRADPNPKNVKWAGGDATLVVAGDLIDKGPKSLAVIDLLRSLEVGAKRAGGRVVVTMGNHEAEFLDDPMNKKATSTGVDEDGIDEELSADHVDPKKLAAGTDPQGRGQWLASLPLAVRVKKWFFAHGGNTQKMSLSALQDKLEHSIAHHGFGDKDITGNDSILEAQGWYGNADKDSAGEDEVNALGHVKHIVFGHDPGAFGDHGKIRQSKNGLLVKLDTAMGLHDGSHGSSNPGYLLHISTQGTDTTEILDARGASSSLKSP